MCVGLIQLPIVNDLLEAYILYIGLALTAETECSVSKATGVHTSATSKELDVPAVLPSLLAAIENETTYEEDKFQAMACIGWMYWAISEYDTALEHLPRSLEQEDININPASTTSEWTNVCALKSAYMRANCLTRKGEKLEALSAFQYGLGSLARVWNGQTVRKQLRYWAELFLTEYCVLSSQLYKENEVSLEEASSLACFRSWAKFWAKMSGPLIGGHGFKGSVPRRTVWKEYYLALTRILEEDLPYPLGYLDKIPTNAAPRSSLRAELKTAENCYKQLLLGETSFPRADEQRDEVEAFVKYVAKNWTIVCGRGWREQDLGNGGRPAISRGVLSTLYACATKTYHSTSVLRFLFQVHLSLAEFDLAFKAFDSYMELVKKGRARVEKTGHPEPSLDDDALVLETMSQCIVALCRYGHGQAAEKARTLGAELEDWLAKLPQFKADTTTPTITENEADMAMKGHAIIPAHVIALTWQAIGVSHAHWSRITWEAASRTEIQLKAIRCLKRSLAAEFGRARDIRSLFSLSLLLAEKRDLAQAIEVVKIALMSTKGQEEDYHLIYGPFWQERSLIPMWHLLALLLSARQDYSAAIRACEGALEQFKDPDTLFGKGQSNFRSEHLNGSSEQEKSGIQQRGLVDDMDDSEKESILEVKMTQLHLLELMEGPEVAVNASYELLALFSRLFGTISSPALLTPPKALEPPKTSGTFRSIRGSIFGGRSRPPTRQSSAAPINESVNTLPMRPGTSQTGASTTPTIQVTEEDGSSRPPVSSRNRSSLRKRSLSRKRSTTKREETAESIHTTSSSAGGMSHQATVVEGESFFTPTTEGDQTTDFFTSGGKKQTQRGSTYSKSGKGLSSFTSYLSGNSTWSDLTVEAAYSSASQLPLVQFTKDKEKATRSTLLIRVWLLIAGFYRRAGMLNDCKGALQETQKLVVSLETDAAKEPAGSVGTHGAAWAEPKNVEELWGDIWAEVSRESYPSELYFMLTIPHLARPSKSG